MTVVTGLARLVRPVFKDLLESELKLTVDLAEAVDPLAPDGALAKYPLPKYAG